MFIVYCSPRWIIHIILLLVHFYRLSYGVNLTPNPSPIGEGSELLTGYLLFSYFNVFRVISVYCLLFTVPFNASDVPVTASNVAVTASNVAVTAPNVAVTASNVPVTAPNVPVTAPDVAVTASNVAVTAPNVAVTAPNVAVTAPNVPPRLSVRPLGAVRRAYKEACPLGKLWHSFKLCHSWQRVISFLFRYVWKPR